MDGRIVLDTSRVIAQIVCRKGFIGAGIIFVGQNLIRGLTTAAAVWLVTAVGMACGTSLPWLGLAVTGACFIVALVFPFILRALPASPVSGERRKDSEHG
jgi:putative Mg2+ transporter-C (MgtC) family protein